MYSVVKVRQCQWCHNPYYLSDGRYKYCSDECAEKARLARCEKNDCDSGNDKRRKWERYYGEYLRFLSEKYQDKRKSKQQKKSKSRRQI